jgi:branched-chain amino acid aminotransferase
MSTTAPTDSAAVTDHLRVWVGGRVHSSADAAVVSAIDHGIVVGDGVFEALKVTAHGPFALTRHLDRLTRSARAMGLPDPDHDQIRQAVDQVLDARTFTEGKIRITYTGGRGPLGSQSPFGPPTLVVAADVRPAPESSVAVLTAPWTRNPLGALAGVKSTSYGENVRALACATAGGAAEAILLNTFGNVCEGTGSNVFLVFGSQIVTPPLSAGPLGGITRNLLLEWCDVTEADLTLAEAKSADEVFLTSSMRDVQAVHRWDDAAFPNAPGQRTAAVAEVFRRRSGETWDP